MLKQNSQSKITKTCYSETASLIQLLSQFRERKSLKSILIKQNQIFKEKHKSIDVLKTCVSNFVRIIFLAWRKYFFQSLLIYSERCLVLVLQQTSIQMQGQRPCTRSQPNKNKGIQKQRNKPMFIPLASVTRSQTRLKSLQDQPQMQEKMIDESMNDDSSTPQTSLQLRQRRPRRTKSFEPTERPKKSKRIQSKQKELARKFRKKRELTKSSHPKQWNSSFSYQQYSPSLDPISEKKESEEDKEGGQAKRQQQQAEQEAQKEKEEQEVLGEQREFGEIGSMLIIEKPESQEHIEAVNTPPHILGLSHHATFLDNTLPEQTSEVEHPEEQIYYEDIDISCYLNL